MFNELEDSSNPIYLSDPGINLNLHRLREVTEMLGEDFIQNRSGQFIIRGKDKELVRDASLALGNFKENYKSVFGRVISDPPEDTMIYVYILPDMETYRKFYPSLLLSRSRPPVTMNLA